MSSRMPEDDLVQVVDRIVRGMPLRRAPASLQPRIVQAVQTRARRQWWRRSVLEWPSPARGTFIGITGMLMLLTMAGLPAAERELNSGMSASIAHVIPLPWLYGLVGVAAALYGFTFCLGALVYRSLYLVPSRRSFT